MARGCGTPLHRHVDDDETFVVLSGALALLVEGERVDAGPGDVVHLPGGAVHAWRAESEEARFLIIATPEHEAFYRDASDPAGALAQPPDAGTLDLERDRRLVGPPRGRAAGATAGVLIFDMELPRTMPAFSAPRSRPPITARWPNSSATAPLG